ncbi:MAG: SPOR domain-containing protein [Paracoccaceae bacterium]
MGIKQTTLLRAGLVGIAGFALAACSENGEFLGTEMFQGSKGFASDAAVSRGADGLGTNTKTVEKDIEAPDVFSATEAGLWDGRPSLGGVWVAHPDVKDPERVIIRNPENGKFVVGALFRREREIPGPRLQISSDAAASLGMLAGAPSPLNVTALRREQVAVAPDPVLAETVDTIEAPSAVTEQALDPIAAAAAALEPDTRTASASPVSTLQSKLAKPYLQVGIFSVENNANRTAEQMRAAGMVPSVRSSATNGKTFWRVIVGPTSTTGERKQVLSKIKDIGFTDAYAVTN